MYEKQRLEMQQQRHAEEDAWKTRVDEEYKKKIDLDKQKMVE